MGDDAVEALVDRRRGDDDQLALGLRETLVRIHQRGVEVEEGPELGRAPGECEEHVRHEPGTLLHGEDLLAHVVRQVVELGHVES